MKFKTIVLTLAAALFAFTAHAQTNTLIETSLSAAVTASQQNITLGSITGILSSLQTSTVLYVDKEAMLVFGSVPIYPPGTGTTVSVQRGMNGTKAVGHISGAMVLAGRPDWFYSTEPTGSCTAANTYVTPYLNVLTGNQWLCSTITLAWVPGFGNVSAPAGVTAAVASAAGQITPSGPLFHITGTAAITGFTYGIGQSAGQQADRFCVIPDGAFTTTATNNIAAASTGVLNNVDCWTWDYKNLKYVPNY